MMIYKMNSDKHLNYKKYFKYICSNFQRKRKRVCDKPVYFDKEWLEQSVIEEINNKFCTQEYLDRIEKIIKENAVHNNSSVDNEFQLNEKEIKKTKNNINHLFETIYKGGDNNLIIPETKKLSSKIKNLEEKREELKKQKKINNKFSKDSMKDLFGNFKNIILNGDDSERALIVISFINKIIFYPVENEIKVEFFKLPQNKFTTILSGARDRN